MRLISAIFILSLSVDAFASTGCNLSFAAGTEETKALGLELIETYRTLEAKTDQIQNPFLKAGTDINKIASVHRTLSEILPGYDQVHPLNEKSQITLGEYRAVRDAVWPSIRSVMIKAEATTVEVHAAMEALRTLSQIEAKTKFPQTRRTERARDPQQQNPSDSQQQPSDSQQQPSDSQQQPSDSQQQPSDSQQQPSDSQQQPSDSQQQPSDSQQQPSDSQQQPSDSQQQPSDSQQQSSEEDGWEDEIDQYEPQLQALQAQSSKTQSKELARFNAVVATSLYPQYIFDVVTEDHWSTDRLLRPYEDLPQGRQRYKFLINTHGKDQIRVPIPPGMSLRPQSGQGFSLVALAQGEMQLQVDRPSENQSIALELRDAMSAPSLTPAQLDAYTQKSKIRLEDWPDFVARFVESIRAETDTLKRAKLFGYFLSESKEFDYFGVSAHLTKNDLDKIAKEVDKHILAGDPKPVAFAKERTFNCDAAAWIYTLIGRDHLNLIVRPIGGHTSEHRIRDAHGNWTILKTSEPKHAWVEVWIDHEWIVIDPTPKYEPLNTDQDQNKSDKPAEDDENAKSRSSDQSQSQEVDSAQDSHESDADESSPSQEASSSNQTDNSKRRSSSSTPNTTDPVEESETTSVDKAGVKEDSGIDPQVDLSPEEVAALEEEAARINTLKDAEWETSMTRELNTGLRLVDQASSAVASKDSHFIKIIAESIELASLEASLMRARGIKSLEQGVEQLERLTQRFPQNNSVINPSIERLKFELAQETMQGTLADKLAEIRLRASNGKLREAWFEIQQLRRKIKQISARRDLRNDEASFALQLDNVFNILNSYKHKDSVAYDLAERFLSALPSQISRQLVREIYGGDLLDLNSPALQAFIADYRVGKLSPMSQLINFGPYVDLMLQSTRAPSYQEEKSFDRARLQRNFKDLVITRSFSDFNRMILTPRPGEHILSDFMLNRQFAVGQKETRQVEEPVIPTERKVTVVYYDVSLSMDGNRVKAQDAILQIIIDKALGEKDKLGRPLHEVYLFPLLKL